MINENRQPSQLPEGWVWTRVGDIATSIKGKKPKILGTHSDLLTIPYVDIQAFEKKTFTRFTDGNDCPICQPEDVLIVWDGARFGLVGKGVGGAIGSTLAKLECYKLNSLYLFYFLQSNFGFINSRPRGVGIPHVEPAILWNINYPLPPLPEQHRIVAKIEGLLSRLDAGQESLKNVKAQLRGYRQAVLKHAFEGKLTEEWRDRNKGEIEPASVLLERIKQEQKKNVKRKYKELPPVDTSDLPELPVGWVWTRLGDIVMTVIKTLPNTKPNEEFIYLDIASIDNKEQKIAQPKRYLGREAPSRARQVVRSGDVLFCTVRTYLKNIAMVSEIYDGQIASTGFCVIRPYVPIRSKLIFHLVQTDFFLNPLSHIQRGTSYPAVRDSDVFAQPIPLPPPAEQEKLVEEIERCFSVADDIEKVMEQSLMQAERLRQSILKRAFHGKLVPQDPTDEPAEKLLERIRVERTKREVEAKTTKKVKGKVLKPGRLLP